MREFVYNPINDKFPSGASHRGETITYNLKVSKFGGDCSANFVMHKEGLDNSYNPMIIKYVDERYIHFEYTFKYEEEGFYWYHFQVVYDSGKVVNLIRSGNLDVVESDGDSDFLQLVIREESKVASNFHKGIIYHIFVDRFNRVGDVTPRAGLTLVKKWNKPVEKEFDASGVRVNKLCYGGNFEGIIDKLPYLKELNVGTIYLSPVFEANSSHKYDIADYSKLDSMFGTTEQFVSLIKKAKKMGMQIILDGVFNHTGSDSVYFNRENTYKTVGAYQSKNSKYYSWYDFSNYPNEYSSWWGFDSLPQTREDSGFFDYIAGKNGIIEKYMSMGIGGYRLDVVDELTNNFVSAICKATRRIEPKAFIVGEVWEDASTKIAYDERKEYFLGGNLDSVTNYPMKNAILNYIKFGCVDEFVSVTNLIKDQYPISIQNNLMNILDTHDTMRALTFLGESNVDNNQNERYELTKEEYKEGVKLLKLASIMQYTVMGIPTVFYGDEAGIQGMKDPYCRAPYPWGKEDAELVEWYKLLGVLRENKVLLDGDMNIRYAENGVIIYERVKNDKKVIVAINRSEEKFEFTLGKTMHEFFTDKYVSGKLVVNPNSAMVLC